MNNRNKFSSGLFGPNLAKEEKVNNLWDDKITRIQKFQISCHALLFNMLIGYCLKIKKTI